MLNFWIDAQSSCASSDVTSIKSIFFFFFKRKKVKSNVQFKDTQNSSSFSSISFFL